MSSSSSSFISSAFLSTLLLFSAHSASALSVPGYSIEAKGTIKLPHPAFLEISKSESDAASLLVSTFGVFGRETVQKIDNLKDLFNSNQDLHSQLLTDQVTWPNEIAQVGPELLGRAGWLVSGGFLVPGKSTGAVTFIDAETFRTVQVTYPKPDFFYHRTQIVHWGPNGSPAILTARAKKPLLPFQKTEAELVLLTPKKLSFDLRVWENQDNYLEEKVLGTGPDVFFQAKDLDGDGIEELVASEFFGKKLELFWWEGNSLKQRVLDSKLGAAFDLEFADLSGNGSTALVVTNHEGGTRGAVYAYEVPKDFKSGTWTRHTLLEGIKTRQGGFNSASPGSPIVFYPSKDHQGKPWIFVSGDGSQRGHLLTAKSADPKDWSYSETIILDTRSTIGKAAIGDVDGDGYVEMFIPAYDANEIHVLAVRPTSGSTE